MKKFNKIVILQKTGIESFALDELEKISNKVVVYVDPPKSNNEIIERCKDADCVLITFTSKLDASVINSLPKLKHIGLCCSLYDDESANVDLSMCRQNNIAVSGVSEYGDDGVIEFIISELTRLLLGTGDNMFYEEPAELKSLKMGIVGLGSLGKKVAKTLTCFDMNISYYGRTKQNSVSYPYKGLDKLLIDSDVISLHLPRNTIVINEAEFNLMKGPKILIDTGVGSSFDEKSFEQWIKDEEHFAIFDTASVSNQFIEQYKHNTRVMINKRVSGFTINARERLSSQVISNLKTHLSN